MEKLEVTAAIIKRNNKFLICQRGADDECPLLWEFLGGKREQGESLEECIIREVKEEIDVTIGVNDLYAKKVYSIKDREIHFTFFNCRIISGDIKLRVHNDVKWVTPKEMKDYEFMPADVEVIERLVKESR